MIDVIYEDNHLLVVNKPTGIATMGAEDGAETMHQLACDYIRHKYQKPGRVFLGVVSRLDRVTSGVLIFARTSKAASRLSAQFSGASTPTTKLYLAVVRGSLSQASGVWTNHVRKDDAARRMRVVDDNAKDAQEARLRFCRLAEDEDRSIVAVKLETGRKHQIRVQFADRGHPLLGDRKYGSRDSFSSGVALHSWQLQITHPTLKKGMLFQAPLPKSWQRFRSLIPPREESIAILERTLDLSFDPEEQP